MSRPTLSALLLTVAALEVCTSSAAPTPLPLDRVLERSGAWTIDRPDRVSAAVAAGAGRSTPNALLLEWRKDLGAVTDGIPTAPQVPSAWVQLPADLDLSRFTTLRFQARIGGPRHGFLHVVVSNQPRMWGEGVKTLIGNVPLRAGDWQGARLSLDLAPLADRRQFRWLGFASINVGHHPGEQELLKTWIDEAVLTAEPPPKREGWAADPSMVVVGRLGFRPFHEKLALVDGAQAGRRFEVRRVDTGAVAFSGTLRGLDSALGRHAVADFTLLTEPGLYHVRASGLESLPFRIGEEANEYSLNLLADWVHGMRCGQETELHPPCHLDDALHLLPKGVPGGPSRRSLNLAGGWHDAGDVRTYYSYSYEMPWRYLRARDTGRRRDRDSDGVDDLLDGSRWALRHAVRLVDPVTGALLDKIDDRSDFRRGNYWSDNLRGTDDDRPVEVGPELSRHVASLAASAGLAMRRAGTDEDRRLARAAVELAERRLAVWVERPAPVRAGLPAGRLRPKVDDRHGHVTARFGLGALQLHLATGKPEHLELARSCADAVLSLQSEGFLPSAVRDIGGDVFPWVLPHEDGDLPELFLAEMLLELPDHEDATRWRMALRRVADWWMKPTRELWGPFPLPSLLLPEKDAAGSPVAVRAADAHGRFGSRWLVPAAGRQQLADTALALQRLAQALEDPELERLARLQLQWAFGHNPFGVSWVAWHDAASIEQMYSFSQGPMPGAVAGYGVATNGQTRCFRPAGAEPVTHAAAELLAAAIAVTEPARLALRIMDGSAPWRGEAVVTWERSGREVARARTDARGRLPELALDGGERYLLRLGDVVVPLAAISGRRIERQIDVRRRLSFSVRANEPAMQSRPFTLAVAVRNEGLAPIATTVRLDAEGVFATKREAAIDLAPGESVVLDWPLRAKSAGRAWLATFRADGTDALADASGVVRKPALPPSAR